MRSGGRVDEYSGTQVSIPLVSLPHEADRLDVHRPPHSCHAHAALCETTGRILCSCDGRKVAGFGQLDKATSSTSDVAGQQLV